MSKSFKLNPQLQQDCYVISELPLSTLLLCNDKNYPWFILVPRVADIGEIYEMDADAQLQFMHESTQLSRILMDEFQGDKLNIAALGNVVPQLHVHHIVRYRSDECWPKPVWGQKEAIFYQEAEVELIKQKIVEPLNQRLNNL